MSKRFMKTAATLCSAVLLATSLVACGGTKDAKNASTASTLTQTQTQDQKPAEPAKLSIISYDAGRVLKEGDPIIKELETKTNTKLEITLVPSGEYQTKFNVLVASGSIPDIVKLGGYDVFQYIPQGIFAEVNSLVDKYGTNMKKVIPQDIWNRISYEKKYYGIPVFNDAGKTINIIRQDWLDNLGLKMPTTLDEYEDVMKKLTFNDPDKNGKNDTYGLGTTGSGVKSYGNLSHIFSAYGVQIDQYYVKDNKIYAADIMTEFKEAIQYIKKLWDEKVIDQEYFIIKGDQANEKMIQGKYASYTTWWSGPEESLIGKYKMNTIQPTVKFSVLPNLKGKNGQSGGKASSIISGVASISAKSKNQEAAFKLLDYMISDEGGKLILWGLQGTHYKVENGKFAGRTDEGNKAFNEKWLDVMAQIWQRTDFMTEMNRVNNPKSYEYLAAARDQKLYYSDVEGITTSEYQSMSADLRKYEDDWFTKFILGTEPISKWDDYVKGWKTRGGQQILEAYAKEYGKRKGTTVTIGQ